MTMAWNIEKLRATGNSADAQIADMLELRLEARGDFDFPETTNEVAIESTVTSNENNADILPAQTVLAELARVSFGDLEERVNMPLTTEGIDKIVDFKNKLTQIFAPYVLATQSKIQHAEKLNGWRKTGEYTWQDQQILDNKLTNVFFKVPYRSYETHNEALGLEIAYTHRDKPHKRDFHLVLNFKDGGVDTFVIEDFKRSPSNFGYHAPDLLRYILSSKEGSRIHNKTNDMNVDSLIIDVLGRRPSESGFSHWFHIQDNVPVIVSRNEYHNIVRTFNPELNTFRIEKNDRGDNLPTILDQSLDVDLVTSFIEKLLGSIPRQG